MESFMMQALHIFRKDVRHLWPEFGVYVLLLVAYAFAAPQVRPGAGSPDPLVQVSVRLLTYLIAIAFFVLIVRLVHEERLVGVEQFWITRPYRWTSLLIAKVLFIVVCVVLPFIAMQWWLLSQAGLGMLASPAGMTRSLLMLCLIVWLPFTLIAAITSTLSEASMVLIGVLVVWVSLLLSLFRGEGKTMSPPFSVEVLAVLFAMMLGGVLIYQYARRRTSRSRIALAVIMALFVLLLYGFADAHFGSPVRAMIRSQYPVSSESSLHLVYMPGSVPYEDRAEDTHVPRGFVEIKLPVRLEGLPVDYKLHNTNVSFTVDVQGFRYISPWQSAMVGDGVLSFVMPQKVFERAATGASHLSLEFLAEKLRPGTSEVVSASDSFIVPNNGRCVLNHGVPVCQYAYWISEPTRVKVSDDHGACGISNSTRSAYTTLRLIPAGTNVDPVIQQVLHLESTVCSGSQLTFSEYHPAGNFRLGLDLPSINLGQYKTR
jgi:hypothetical protein